MALVTSDVREPLKAIRKLKRELTLRNGSLQKEIRKGASNVQRNVIQRFKRVFPNRDRGPDVARAIKDSGFEVFLDAKGDVTVAMFDEDKLDLLTALKPTIVTGEVYSLWRLLSAGFGMKGSGREERGHIGPKKSTPYPLYVFLQNSGVMFGRFPPYPELLELEGQGVFVVRHSGFGGRRWFTANGRLFKKDTFDMFTAIERGLTKSRDKARLR